MLVDLQSIIGSSDIVKEEVDCAYDYFCDECRRVKEGVNLHISLGVTLLTILILFVLGIFFGGHIKKCGEQLESSIEEVVDVCKEWMDGCLLND